MVGLVELKEVWIVRAVVTINAHAKSINTEVLGSKELDRKGRYVLLVLGILFVKPQFNIRESDDGIV